MKKKCFTLFFLLISAFIFAAQNLHVFKHNGLYGYFNDEMKVVVDAIYPEASPFYDGEALVKLDEEKYGILNENGERQKLPDYFDDKNVDLIYRLSSHCYRLDTFEKDPNDFSNYPRRYNCIYLYNTKNNQYYRAGRINFSYMSLDLDYYFSAGCDLGYGYFDDDLNLNPANQEDFWLKLYPMRDGAALAVDNKHNHHLIDSNYNIILEEIGDSGSEFHDGLMPMVYNKKIGYVNTKGEFVIETSFYAEVYDFFPPTINYDFSEGVAVPQVKKGIWRSYDTKGKILMQDRELFFCSKQQEGLIRFQKEKKGKFGFMDKYGYVEIPCNFDKAEDFVYGYALVEIDGKDALLKPDGSIVYSEELVR
ncbi:MAG: WG repeat-containing protein [Treponema sp.]|nr:WG repeat-containing protein [Treponema sp.]